MNSPSLKTPQWPKALPVSLASEYAGILYQDGCETLELTVRDELPRRLANQVIAYVMAAAREGEL